MSTSDDYSQRFPGLAYTRWTTGEMVSQAGFGCYRVNSHNPEHARALRKALQSGINCIDTAANYGDGAAEELVGSVLALAQEQDGIGREECVVVTKAGYIQGRNYHRAHKREHQGHAFPQLVKFDDALWHCIHPEFLEDQLTRSIRHMNTPYIDVFLLHNPEYFLIQAQREGVALEEARTEFYQRIRLAFEYLESEVQSGRIHSYGISSNCFGHPADEPDFVSLEECWNQAESVAGDLHHFRCIQLPLNLLECGAAAQLNQQDETLTVLEFAKAHGINVMVNRVLNAITQSSLIRLAEHAFAGTPAPSESDIAAALGDLIAHENVMIETVLPTLPFEEHSRDTLADYLTPGAHLITHWENFEGIEHWHEVEAQYLRPRMNEAIEAILHHPTPGLDEWIAEFKKRAQHLFMLITHHYAVQSQPRLLRIKEKAIELLGEEFAPLSVSQLAFSAPRATEGVTCTLIGARRESYVNGIVQSLKLELPALDRVHWSALSGIVESVTI